MRASVGTHLGGVRLLQGKFAQVQERSKTFFNLYDGFGKDLEKKLAQEEEELSRAKDNLSTQSQEPVPDNHKLMEEEPLPEDQAEIENDELTDQVCRC
jgi:hypothetical protein